MFMKVQTKENNSNIKVFNATTTTLITTTKMTSTSNTTKTTTATSMATETSCTTFEETTSTTCLPITESATEPVECVTKCVETVEIVAEVVPITEEVLVAETVSEMEIVKETDSAELTYVKHFSRGTYYAYGGARNGGSGRALIDCSCGDGDVKGSIASSYLYNNYEYNVDGRTKVYLEIEGYSDMNGWYYLDDSDAGNSEVIDFFYYYDSNCQFQYQGVVQVDCYI